MIIDLYEVLRKIKRIFRTWYWMPYLYKKRRETNIIFFESSVDYSKYKVKRSNWGDDLNYFFFNEICKDRFICIPYNRLIGKRDTHYLLIGSILTFFNLNNSIIYGSGIQYPTHPIKGKPDRIISVRGPRTRKILVSKGIECPEKYGDPALLLSHFYKSEVKQKDIVSIIPNEGTIREKKDELVRELSKKYGCKIINLREYTNWKSIIDRICESKLVVSESLHGLIVAETYGIPSVWVEFIKHPKDWDFKFLDFYESIGKYGMTSYKLNEGYNWEKLLDSLKYWKPGYIDYADLLSVFPFEIKEKYKLFH